MQGSDIANRLKQVISQYTDDFSDISAISSLSRSGNIITATTSAAHGLKNGNYITIRGAKNPITINSLSRIENIVSVITASDHQLIDPSQYGSNYLPLMIEISGCIPTDYNGKFELLTVSDSTHFTFRITTTPAAVTTLGFLLLQDFDSYNGYKQITITSSTSFTYAALTDNLQSPAQGIIQLSNYTRIAYAGTPERIVDFYSEDSSRTFKKWLFAVVGSKLNSKDGTTASDLSVSKGRGENYLYDSQQLFSIFVFLPSSDDILGGAVSDQARLYEKPITKSLADFQFKSPLEEKIYDPAIYVGSEPDNYNGALYAHRFDFSAAGYIQQKDVADQFLGVPLKEIDGNFEENGMIFKPLLR